MKPILESGPSSLTRCATGHRKFVHVTSFTRRDPLNPPGPPACHWQLDGNCSFFLQNAIHFNITLIFTLIHALIDRSDLSIVMLLVLLIIPFLAGLAKANILTYGSCSMNGALAQYWSSLLSPFSRSNNLSRCLGYDAAKGCQYPEFNVCAKKHSHKAQGSCATFSNMPWSTILSIPQPNVTANFSKTKVLYHLHSLEYSIF